MQSVHLSFAPLAINLSSTLKVSPQRCRICLHSHLACEESPSVFKCLRSATNYALLKFTLVFCLPSLCHLQEPTSSSLGSHTWLFVCYLFTLTVSTGGLSLIPVLSNSAIRLGQSSSFVATQKLPCHKPSTQFLLVVLRLYAPLRFLWLVITFLIWKISGWIEVIWKLITDLSLFEIPSIWHVHSPYHSRWHQIWRSHKCIRNAFIMFKYVIQFANTANSLPNLDFDNRYVGTANFQAIFEICMTHKSLLSTGTSDLYSWHILSLHFMFASCTYLMTNLEFPNEFVAIMYQFPYLRGMQIQCHLLCKYQKLSSKYNF